MTTTNHNDSIAGSTSLTTQADGFKANLPISPLKPWLIAAWPGMGNVGVIAASTLINQRGFAPIAEITAEGAFDAQGVIISGGIVKPIRQPRSIFYSRADQGDLRPLIVFAAEAQPNAGQHAFAKAVVDQAKELGAEKIITFASLPSQMHPSADARVFAVATDDTTLGGLKRLELNIMEDGQVGGQAGLLLGAAAAAGISGICLMGEIPFFAPGVPNPGAAAAVLEAFGVMHGSDVNTAALDRDAKVVETNLLELLKRTRQHAADEIERSDDRNVVDNESAGESEVDTSEEAQARANKLEVAEAKNRIEALFMVAKGDKDKISALKKELDSQGAFRRYENRFLDLFREKTA